MIADDEDEMCVYSGLPHLITGLMSSVEAARRMTGNYDFVVTSGGIGPTHDGKSRYSSSFSIYSDTQTLHTHH